MLKPNGSFWLAIGDEFAAELKMIVHREHGLHCRSWVIWYYTFGVNCKYKFSRSHAHLLYFVKDPENFKFNLDPIMVPSARQLIYADLRANPKGRLPDDTWILRPQEVSAENAKAIIHYGTFPELCGTFKEPPAGTAARCPSSSLVESSSRARTPATSCSTPSPAAEPR